MKLVFMGTPAGAAFLLKKIFDSKKHEILAVVTTIDKPSGRGQKMAKSEVCETAEELGLPVYKIQTLKDERILSAIKKLSPDIIVVVAFGKILPKEFLEIPKYFCLNVHFSLLPKYRGASPIQSALLNGDKETGITIIKMNEKLDAGEIISQKKVPIFERENSQQLSERLFIESSSFLLQTIDDIENGNIKLHPQDDSFASYCATIKKEDGFLDIKSIGKEKFINFVRAFTPWPGVYLKYKDKRVKILSAEISLLDNKDAIEGEIIAIDKDMGIIIKTKDGSVLIREIQPENSKPMSAISFANGYRVKAKDIFTNVK